MTWALAAVGLVVLLAGGFLFCAAERAAKRSTSRIRRAIRTMRRFRSVLARTTNPFAGIGDDGDQMTMASPDARPFRRPFSELTGGRAAIAETARRRGCRRRAARRTGTKPSPFRVAVFDAEGDSEEKEMDDMEVISRDAGEREPRRRCRVMGGIPEEFQQMMREMKRRVEALEGRVDELVDARDRLERQVAAQTEELRVQRAAIARTQRAVRNLARPEERRRRRRPSRRCAIRTEPIRRGDDVGRLAPAVTSTVSDGSDERSRALPGQGARSAFGVPGRARERLRLRSGASRRARRRGRSRGSTMASRPITGRRRRTVSTSAGSR